MAALQATVHPAASASREHLYQLVIAELKQILQINAAVLEFPEGCAAALALLMFGIVRLAQYKQQPYIVLTMRKHTMA